MEVKFEWNSANPNSVLVKGSWDWNNPVQLHKKESGFEGSAFLAPGIYEYGFEVDGSWQIRKDLQFVQNDSYINNQIEVKPEKR